MNYISTLDIRKQFYEFFRKKQYYLFESSLLIPKNDNTILFTNAGMNQFKDVFIRKTFPVFDKISTIQRCLRAGGKHNDLEEVGYTNRHHTFFEMLGNFSFGKVNKEEIIKDIWQLLTNKDQYNISCDRLYVTVNKNDIETYNIWLKIIGINKNNIFEVSNNNFWQMSDVGPCGYCTEIFYCMDIEINKFKNIKEIFFDTPDYFLEIWNIVFIQYNKIIKKSRNKENYVLLPLNTLNIDTGAGVERLSSVLQNVNSNYKIDLFKNLIKAINSTIDIKTHHLSNHYTTSLNVISDHIRSIIFLIHEGLVPYKDGRGYVLRRIIRRAIRYGRYLGIKNKFLYTLIEPCIQILQSYYSEILFDYVKIKEIVKQEEDKYYLMLNLGIKKLYFLIKKLNKTEINEKLVNNLYQTYGLPLDLSLEICKEKNIIIKNLTNF